MRRHVLVLAAIFALAWTAPAAAQEAWTIDPDHSQVLFFVKHALSHVAGRFERFSGDIAFDPDLPEKSRITFAIMTVSLDTGIERRDRHLLSEDFFDAGKYPLVHFASDDIRKNPDGTYEARGALSIKDKVKEIAIPLRFTGKLDSHPAPELRCNELLGLEAEFVIDRLDYNVGDASWTKKGLIGKDVRVQVFLELLRPKPGCTPPK